jgi:hypothetical protein
MHIQPTPRIACHVLAHAAFLMRSLPRDRVNNVDVLGVELAQNFKSVTDMWNRKTNNWLRYYVYMRLAPADGKVPFSVTALTYLTSAFWHVRTHAPTGTRMNMCTWTDVHAGMCRDFMQATT